MKDSLLHKCQNKIMYEKIRGKSGETISETLVALLIAALALVMLAGAIGAATRIITNSRDRVNEYYDANQNSSGVVMMSGSAGSGTYTIENEDGKTIIEDETVNCYANQALSKPVVSFREE